MRTASPPETPQFADVFAVPVSGWWVLSLSYLDLPFGSSSLNSDRNNSNGDFSG
jgi:hypothetical protein